MSLWPIDETAIEPQKLSPREIEVLHHISTGLRRRTIAAKLFISPETVKSHMKHILYKLNATNQAHAVSIAYKLEILPIAEETKTYGFWDA